MQRQPRLVWACLEGCFPFNFYFKLILSFLSWRVSCISWTLVDYLCKCDKQSFSKIINETSLLQLPIELHCWFVPPNPFPFIHFLYLFLPNHLLLYIFSIVLRRVNMIRILQNLLLHQTNDYSWPAPICRFIFSPAHQSKCRACIWSKPT